MAKVIRKEYPHGMTIFGGNRGVISFNRIIRPTEVKINTDTGIKDSIVFNGSYGDIAVLAMEYCDRKAKEKGETNE
jgi:hypothetical protein